MMKTVLLIFGVTMAAYGTADLIARLLYRLLFCGGSFCPVIYVSNDTANEIFLYRIAAWRFFGADARCKLILVSEKLPDETVRRACRRHDIVYCSEEQLQKTLHSHLKK